MIWRLPSSIADHIIDGASFIDPSTGDNIVTVLGNKNPDREYLGVISLSAP